MPGDLDNAFSIKNLERAWRWTHTNSEALFKNYFRHIYRAYSLSAGTNLEDLRKRLVRGLFLPTHATKLYFPKKSGIQRIYSLLTIEDQIVYQAMVNIIAERLLPQVRKKYYKSVFGHLYAGKTSLFFYRKWGIGYRRFSEAIRKAFVDGYWYTASFDLTACYDSIDHAVLKHFLLAINLEHEFCDRLCELLHYWTASSSQKPIYQGHGIPQGPLPSGLLSETVLSHFDDHKIPVRKIRYFRYVDDIRLFAKSDKDLRKYLTRLDLLSKEIGLFPQSSKIDIHRVHNIEDEIKSVSHPPEPVNQRPDSNQRKIRLRLKELSPRFVVSNETRFKYVLAYANPNASLNRRLLTIVERQPHLYVSVFNCLARAKILSQTTSQQCIALLKGNDIYPAFTAALISTLRGRIYSSCQKDFERYCRSRLSGRDGTNNPELRAAAASVLLQSGSITWNQAKYNILWKEDWWVRTEVIRYVRRDLLGDPSYEFLLNSLLRDKIADVAIVAAELLISETLSVHKPIKKIPKLAQFVLKASGIIGAVGAGACPISEAMVDVLGKSVQEIDWRKMLGQHYKALLRKIARWRGYVRTDPTAWINLTDTVNDLILDALFRHDSNIGSYQLGSIGSILNADGRFAKRYPSLFQAAKEIHSKRLESDLSHPITRNTKRLTKHIRFKELEPLKVKLRAGYSEMYKKI